TAFASPRDAGLSRGLRSFILSNAAALGRTRWEDAPAPSARALATRNAALEPAKSAAPPLQRSISPASPVEGFESFVYEAALKAVLPLAEKAGYRTDNLRFTFARLMPRAWGEDWRFVFVSPREGHFKEPRRYSVTVRRTMVSETQVDAFDAKDEGPMSLFTGYMASEVPAALKVSPMEVVARSGPEASTLEVQARWSDGNGPAELVYVVRDAKGRELESVNAATGAVKVPEPYAWVRGALVFLGGLAMVALLYGALAYAVMHAPAAVSSTPFVPDAGWSSLFGR
ncbi:MAG: hypothetical protein KGL53_00065, partial [Elusimicrobia bacterium]|nr:hypothetical protein [Elusimicrobiota bacterium]